MALPDLYLDTAEVASITGRSNARELPEYSPKGDTDYPRTSDMDNCRRLCKSTGIGQDLRSRLEGGPVFRPPPSRN